MNSKQKAVDEFQKEATALNLQLDYFRQEIAQLDESSVRECTKILKILRKNLSKLRQDAFGVYRSG